MHNNIRLKTQLITTVFSSPLYLSIMLLAAAMLLVFSIWLPNLGLIWKTTLSSNLSFMAKTAFLWHSLGAITTNFSLLSVILTIIVSVLFGLNIAFAIFYFKKRIGFQKTGGISTAGILVGLIGVGCASCGSVLLSALLGTSATIVFTSTLPLGGQEFSLLSIVILTGALCITAKKINDPMLCKLKPKH